MVEEVEPEADERRVWVRYPCDLGSSCQPTIGGVGMSWSARVRDLSRGGAKLIADRRFESGTILHLHLDDDPSDGPSSLLCRVVHVSALTEGKWALGCRFAKELSEKDLRALLRAY